MSKYTFYIELYDKNEESLGRQEAKFDFEDFKVSIAISAFTYRILSASRLCIVENQNGLTFATNPQKLDTDSIVYDTDMIKVSHEIDILSKDKPIVHSDIMAGSATKKLVFNRDL
jgi:hypothetical protein